MRRLLNLLIKAVARFSMQNCESIDEYVFKVMNNWR